MGSYGVTRQHHSWFPKQPTYHGAIISYSWHYGSPMRGFESGENDVMEENRVRGGVSTAGDVLSGRVNLHVGRKAPPNSRRARKIAVPFGARPQSRRVTETSAMGQVGLEPRP